MTINTNILTPNHKDHFNFFFNVSRFTYLLNIYFITKIKIVLSIELAKPIVSIIVIFNNCTNTTENNITDVASYGLRTIKLNILVVSLKGRSSVKVLYTSQSWATEWWQLPRLEFNETSPRLPFYRPQRELDTSYNRINNFTFIRNLLKLNFPIKYPYIY